MNLDFGNHSFDIVSAMRGDGFGGFDEQAIRASLKAMRQADRMRLWVAAQLTLEIAAKFACFSIRLHILLDSCLPGDVVRVLHLVFLRS